MNIGAVAPGTIIVFAAAVVALVGMAFLFRWILRIDQIIWLLARTAGLPEEAARRRTLRGMKRELQLQASGEAPQGAPAGRPRARSGNGASAALRAEPAEPPAPAGPKTTGREIAFQDLLRDAEGKEYRVVGSVSSGLLVETPTGARDVILPINPDDARKDWEYPVDRVSPPA